MGPEQSHHPEIDPELIEEARFILEEAGAAHLADVVMNKGSEADTILHGLARRLPMLEETNIGIDYIRDYVFKLARDNGIDPTQSVE